MVSRGLSHAASLLLLAMGSKAFVPTKFGAGVRAPMNTPLDNKLESCDSVLSRMDGKSLIILDAQAQEVDLEQASSSPLP
mmetsp:Transcript_611/g.1032  ORF Transcript_611/g.1032 Transcript_611/m.1032 type:complete len:80 (+) Transcript_611:77-316(+)